MEDLREADAQEVASATAGEGLEQAEAEVAADPRGVASRLAGALVVGEADAGIPTAGLSDTC